MLKLIFLSGSIPSIMSEYCLQFIFYWRSLNNRNLIWSYSSTCDLSVRCEWTKRMKVLHAAECVSRRMPRFCFLGVQSNKHWMGWNRRLKNFLRIWSGRSIPICYVFDAAFSSTSLTQVCHNRASIFDREKETAHHKKELNSHKVVQSSLWREPLNVS